MYQKATVDLERWRGRSGLCPLGTQNSRAVLPRRQKWFVGRAGRAGFSSHTSTAQSCFLELPNHAEPSRSAARWTYLGRTEAEIAWFEVGAWLTRANGRKGRLAPCWPRERVDEPRLQQKAVSRLETSRCGASMSRCEASTLMVCLSCRSIRGADQLSPPVPGCNISQH